MGCAILILPMTLGVENTRENVETPLRCYHEVGLNSVMSL